MFDFDSSRRKHEILHFLDEHYPPITEIGLTKSGFVRVCYAASLYVVSRSAYLVLRCSRS